MTQKILVANRGEIAIRIIRAAAELGIPTVAVFSKDDANALHTRMADQCKALGAIGAGAYLNMDAIVDVAKSMECSAIHPGYGFLSENAEFARRCEAAGITFIGPVPESLDLFGDKTRARVLAKECDVPLLPGTLDATSLEEAENFFAGLGSGGAMMIKAVSGGGGRGMRPVHDAEALKEAYNICQSEARAAFGNGVLYVERLVTCARHIEVQVMGDGTGEAVHLWERECSLQRRNQKVVEIAPSPSVSESLREKLTRAALEMARKAKLKSLATFEFLVDGENPDSGFYFMEVNPRLQVEHTVTEEVTGIDLVQAQIKIATGSSLEELGLIQKKIPAPKGYAVQCRINMEEIQEDGEVKPSGGVLSAFNPPLGPGIRVDTMGYQGYETSPNFDSLLAKLITHSKNGDYAQAVSRAYRALCEFRIDGVKTNIPLLLNLLKNEEVASNNVTTGFIQENLSRLVKSDGAAHRCMYFPTTSGTKASSALACSTNFQDVKGPEGTAPVPSTMQGTIVKFEVAEGDMVPQGKAVAILEAMKMQHIIKAPQGGKVRLICAEPGETLAESQPLMFIEPMEVDDRDAELEKEADLDAIRPDLEEVLNRHKALMDESRPKAVEKRRATNQRTARENIDDLLDPDSFIEYGALALAAQRERLSQQALLERSPADGLITGMGSINGDTCEDSRCMVLAYDFTVMAGTQGFFNHKKTDRMLHLAREWKVPVVLFAEGGGGRPGDMDAMRLQVAGLDLDTFHAYAALSGLVPLVGIVSGRCFAGNAALLGCNDVIIATKDSNIGMGGPAMIEGGGLGACSPDDIGPIGIQAPNGVVDVVVEDEAEAVAVAKKYLSYFQGPLPQWDCTDQRLLRKCIPQDRLRAYDIRNVIYTLADKDSVLELRKDFGIGIVTALVRIEGQPFGLAANNTMHLGGAIDSDAADKISRFTQLCDAFDISMVVLSDTPGFMVGPEAEKSAQVRHFCRMFNTGAGATVPVFSVVLRKGYGLGAMAMVGGGYHRPVFNVAWPTGEFGGMGLEGAVRLGFKKELEAIEDPNQRQMVFESMVAAAYDHGKGTNMAAFLEIDGVIDPLETRRWIMRGFKSMPKPEKRQGKKRPCVDTW